ncbi:MAG: hypothetical protein ACI8XB_001674 [Patiriisocius sp.]
MFYCLNHSKFIVLSAYGFVYPKDYNMPVIITDHRQLLALIKGNPYLESVGEQIELLYVTFFKSIPDKEKVNAFNELSFSGDKYTLCDNQAHLKYQTKASNSKLSNNIMESKLKVTCTSRN